MTVEIINLIEGGSNNNLRNHKVPTCIINFQWIYFIIIHEAVAVGLLEKNIVSQGCIISRLIGIEQSSSCQFFCAYKNHIIVKYSTKLKW